MKKDNIEKFEAMKESFDDLCDNYLYLMHRAHKIQNVDEIVYVSSLKAQMCLTLKEILKIIE